MGLLHEELTYLIRGCVFDVYNALGRGHNEESYHLAMEQRLAESDISFQSKEAKHVKHRGKPVHKFIADLIIEGKVIIELKNIQTDFLPINYLQIISYLKCWNKELGLLVNFGLESAKDKRVLYVEKELIVEENYDSIKDLIGRNNRDHLLNISNAAQLIG